MPVSCTEAGEVHHLDTAFLLSDGTRIELGQAVVFRLLGLLGSSGRLY